MGARRRGLTIGAVLDQLQPDFPDITVSKIRFLEAEGLVTPARTPSGYRTFSPADVERLRFVLAAQRDRFWPLKVIREALDAMDRGLTMESQSSHRPHVPASDADVTGPAVDELTRPVTLRLTGDELCDAASLDKATFAALQNYGLLAPDRSGHFDDDALNVARVASALAVYGLEPRHLRPFRTAADREIGLVEQVTLPMRSRRGDESVDPTPQILAHCVALHTALVRAGLRR